MGPSSQRICYRPFQNACECASFVTEDCLSSFSNCMGEWVLANKGSAIVLFRLHVSLGPYSQMIYYHPVPIVCKSGFLLTEDLLSSCSDCIWVWVLHHREFAIILFRMHVSVGPSSHSICYLPFQIACESGFLLTEDLLSSFSDCMWEWVLHHRGFAIALFRLHVRVGPDSQRICYRLIRLHVSAGPSSQRIYYRLSRLHVSVGSSLQKFAIVLFRLHTTVGPSSQRICYRPVQIACECRSFNAEDLLLSFSDCMWVWVLTHRGFTIVCSDCMWVWVLHNRSLPSFYSVACWSFITEDLLSSFQIACERGSFKETICCHSP
jgi:hypothetical protein